MREREREREREINIFFFFKSSQLMNSRLYKHKLTVHDC